MRLAQYAAAGLALAYASTTVAQTDLQRRWWATVNSGELDAVAAMLASGAVRIGTLIDGESNTALHLAAERCNAELVRFLMDRGADPERRNVHNDSPLRIAQVRCGASSGTTAALQQPAGGGKSLPSPAAH